MEDKRLEKRKEFLNPVKDGKVKREKYMVDLRKKRKQEMFRSKRRIRICEESKDYEDGGVYKDEDGVIICSKKEGFPLKKYENELRDIVPVLYTEDIELVRRFGGTSFFNFGI